MPAAATQRTGKRSKRGRLSEGAPTLRTKGLTDFIALSISLGLTDEESALIAGIKPETLCRWRRIPEFDQALKRATAIRLRDRLLLINARVENWQAIGWLIERQFPTRFSKPEVQISLSNSFNQTVNALSITIAPEEARAIEAVAEPCRQKVRQMLAAYRPGLGNGNGQEALSVEKPANVVGAPIARKDGDEDSTAFWNLFASCDGEREVEKKTAIYVVASIVGEAVGRGVGQQASTAFKGEPVTVADVLATIDKLCGGSPVGWQLLQKKANYSASP